MKSVRGLFQPLTLRLQCNQELAAGNRSQGLGWLMPGVPLSSACLLVEMQSSSQGASWFGGHEYSTGLVLLVIAWETPGKVKLWWWKQLSHFGKIFMQNSLKLGNKNCIQPENLVTPVLIWGSRLLCVPVFVCPVFFIPENIRLGRSARPKMMFIIVLVKEFGK